MTAQKKLALTSKSTSAHTPIGQKYGLAIGHAHRCGLLQHLADLRGCHVALVHHWQLDLQVYCQEHADCADGRLPYDDQRAVLVAGPADHLGPPADLLRDALRAGVLARRWGHLHLAGFKRRYPNAAAHRRAASARRVRDAGPLRARAAELQRRRRARVKADMMELRAQERWPSALPQRPAGGRRLQGPIHVTRTQDSSFRPPRCHAPEHVLPAIISAQKPLLAPAAQPAPKLPDPCDIHLTSILRTPIDALKRIAEARSSKSQRNSYSVPLKPLHLENLVNPLPPSGDEGSRQVCMDLGAAERPADPPNRPGSAADAPSGSEGSGQADPLGNAANERPSEQASPAVGKRLEPALFAQVLQHLVKAGCGRPETQEAAEQMLGPDYDVLAAHRRDGKAGMAALALESEAERLLVVRLLCRKHAQGHARRQGEAAEAARAAHAAAKACRQLRPPDPPPKPPQAATAPLRPPAEPDPRPPGRPRHCYRPPPHRDRRAPRVRGQPAGQLPAGACTLAELRRLVAAEPDLPRIKVPMAKILALGLSPERVALAFREAKAGLRDPQALGWAALTRMLRITGDLPPLPLR